MLALMAQMRGGFGAWGFGEIVIAIIVIISIVAIGFIVLRASGIPIPPWVWSIVWVVVLCFVAIFAIRLIMNM